MSELKRLIIDVDDDWQVTVRSHDGDRLSDPRSLRRSTDADEYGHHYPLPPADEIPPQGESHADLLADESGGLIAALHDAISRRNVQDEASIRYGRYLLDTLIGRPLWALIDQFARQSASDDTIELALSAPRSMIDFHRLHWELLCRPADPQHSNRYGFVADSFPRLMAITRLVKGTQHPAIPMGVLPRILFVIGTSLTDRRVRPGAEYFGMLRHLSSQNASARHRVLQGASTTRLHAIVTQFKPDVVHFICHGYHDEQGGYLELETAQGADKRRYAAQLLYDLRFDDRYPCTVVLSACYSAAPTQPGSPLGTNTTGSLAAELVAGGIPVVVGMSGEVSDLACRLYTRRFAEALMHGDSLVTATAQGRSAALYEGRLAQDSVDWAFPTLVLSEGVAPDFQPHKPGSDRAAETLERRVRGLNLDSEPIFCARQEHVDLYYRLVEPSDPLTVLAYYTMTAQSGIGKSRLLQELTARAVRDGHIPCLVTGIPHNLRDLGSKVLDAIEQTRSAFGLDPAYDSQLFLLTTTEVHDLLAAHLLAKRIEYQLQRDQKLTPKVLQLAIYEDVASMCDEIYPEAEARQHYQPLLLLDEVDQYSDDSPNSQPGDLVHMVTGEMLGSFGLGDAKMPIPVVLAFAYKNVAEEILKKNIIETSKGWIQPKEVKPFQEENDEDLLAYKLVLLHKSKINPQRVAFNDRAPSGTRATVVQLMRKYLMGIPDKFNNADLMNVIVDFGVGFDFFLPGDDEEVLRALLERQQDG